jgi:site-specific DNA-methyltransferase (adenine-specific)
MPFWAEHYTFTFLHILGDNGGVMQNKTSKRKLLKNSATTSFGSPGREGHDSSAFYETRLYADQPQAESEAYVENPISDVDLIFNHSSEEMGELPDNSVHLMVTSPPYNVGKEYDENLTLEEYLAFLRRVWEEVYRVLVPGGRVCVNVANLGRKPYIPLNGLIAKDLINLGFLMRGEIIWSKAASASTSTAWGSWQSATNPTLRDTHEYILVFSKGSFRREKVEGRESTITKDEFLEFTKSVWEFTTESAKKVGHPAPFPVELPYRLIQLYTFSNEILLDPFMGSGQTATAALKSGRHFVGYEVNEEYVKLAWERIRGNQDTSVDSSAE